MKKINFLKKLTCIAGCALSSITLLSNLSYAKKADSCNHKKTSSYNKIELFYYQGAGSAEIKPVLGKKSCYNLTLFNLSPNAIYLATHPIYKSGQLTTYHFSKSISNSLSKTSVKPISLLHGYINEPNVEFEDEKFAISRFVKLYSASYDTKNKTMHYFVCDLYKNQSPIPSSLKFVDFFIDPFHRWPP